MLLMGEYENLDDQELVIAIWDCCQQWAMDSVEAPFLFVTGARDIDLEDYMLEWQTSVLTARE